MGTDVTDGVTFDRDRPRPRRFPNLRGLRCRQFLGYRTSTLMYLPTAKGAGTIGVNLMRSLASFRT